MADPTNITEVRQFVGLASYYHCYIPHFSDIAVPLNALTQKGAWVPSLPGVRNGFQYTKAVSFSSTCPYLPHSASDFDLQADASAIGLGAEWNSRACCYLTNMFRVLV